MENKWHIPDIKTLEKELRTNASEGLTIREARSRLEAEKKRDGGRSSLFVETKMPSVLTVFSFFAHPATALLVIISMVTAAFGHTWLGLLVLGVTLAGAISGGLISWSSQRKLCSMRDYASPMVKVKRGGNKFFTDGKNAVVGDIIFLNEGDLVPCDARLLQTDSLEVKELIHTKDGIRNRDVAKDASVVYSEKDEITAPNAQNMVYAGSAIIKGSAVAVVTETDKNVYLYPFMDGNVLSGNDPECQGVKSMKPFMQKIIFLSLSSLVILSLLSLVTLPETSFISKFLMLLSSFAMISVELLSAGSRDIFSRQIMNLSRHRRRSSAKRKDLSASVRNVKALDTLTGITDIALMGTAGIVDGSFHLSDTYTSRGILKSLTPDSKIGNRLLTYVHTYVKAIKESNIENDFINDGVADSLAEHLRICGFDVSGATLVLRSLYYTGDTMGKSGYACAETADSGYRVALTFDENILEKCNVIRENESVRELSETDVSNIQLFIKNAIARHASCLYIVSETNGESVLEGILSLEHYPAAELSAVLPQLEKMGISLTVMLKNEDNNTVGLVSSPALSPIFCGEIAYKSSFRKSGEKITDNVGKYCAYIGFSVSEYSELIQCMRKKGARVAAYGVDNDYNDPMSQADVAISCDVLNYSSEKYKESVYERLVPEGRDTNVRCSQQTRLLSKVIVHRTHANGGGLLSVLNAIRTSRSAYISLSQSVLLFAMLMSNLLPVIAVSVIVGSALLNAAQTASLAVSAAMLSIIVFSQSEPKPELMLEKRDYTAYPLDTIKSNLVGMIARCAVGAVATVAIKILDSLNVFGESPSYAMAVYISLLLTVFAELFIINVRYMKNGEGRRMCWLNITLIYALLLAFCGLMTLKPISAELLPGGIGTREFLIIPVYLFVYLVAVLVSEIIRRNRKKR